MNRKEAEKAFEKAFQECFGNPSGRGSYSLEFVHAAKTMFFAGIEYERARLLAANNKRTPNERRGDTK